AHLAAVLDGQDEPGAAMLIAVIVGTGGIGKTWLALQWAYQHLDRFPDGQLHVNLRGFDPSGSPVPPAMVMRGFLDALGVESTRIPSELDAQIGLYRSLLAGRRMLVVLDNARDTAQVAALLPGSPTCVVLVTSRHRLDGLTTAHGARLLHLGFLTDDEARELLASRIGRERFHAEPDAVEELLAYCAGLPLAVSVAAARVGRQPQFPLNALVEELRDRRGRLDALETGDSPASLRAVLSWSYHMMSPTTGAAFGLLGLAPGNDISLYAAASLLGLSTADARLMLRELDHGHLVQQHAPGRYRMHDLVHLYAMDRTGHDHAEESRARAMRRLIDFYVHTAFAADRLLQPLLPPVKLGEPVTGCQPCPLPDQRAALAWFTVERANLLAAQDLAAARGWAESVYQLAWVLTTFLYRQGDFHAVLAVWQAGQTAAQQVNDPVTQTGAHQLLGAVFTELGRHTDALRHLTLAQDLGDLSGQAYTHHSLGWFWSLQGDNRRAVEHASRALQLCRSLALPAGETRQLTLISWYHAQLGDHESARTSGERALRMARRHQYREDEALAMGILGYIAQHTGQYTAAVDWFEQSHALLRRVGSTYFEATVLDALGRVNTILGEPEAAYRAWQRALQLCQQQHRTADVDRIQRQLDALHLRQPDLPDA
ncbi:MAG TPA: tetratricopeptide repeat protein, partial [Pilimelia sp.]|nr:tetratricopeptide repeat protein [Pilimelia sp.]